MPFSRCNDGGKIGFATLLGRFRSVGWSAFLLKCSLLSDKVATGSKNQHDVQDITAVNALVIFYTLIYNNLKRLTGAADSNLTVMDFGF